MDGATTADFRQLLRVMFLPSNSQVSMGNAEESNSNIPNIHAMSWRDWASVYLLSNKWDMENIREKALRNMSTLPTNADEWIAVLRLSTSWSLPMIRKKAIQSLATYNIDVEVMVQVAKDCKVPDLLLRGYKGIVQRQEEIEVEEAERLGWETTLSLLRIRDQYLSNRGHNVESDLRRAFKTELKGLGIYFY
jgi:hypothetical protein